MPSQDNRTSWTTQRITITAMLAALALIFSWIEAILPFQPGLPGVKLGLANFVIVTAMYRMNNRYAFGINMVRVVLAGFLFSGLSGLIYSLAGSLLSFLVMALTKRTGKFSVIGVSMAGGVAHNVGQLLIAMLVVSNLALGYYLPVLWFSGMAAGIAVGIGAAVLIRHLPVRLFGSVG
jgi:heptaprenyl diphosphate synthase